MQASPGVLVAEPVEDKIRTELQRHIIRDKMGKANTNLFETPGLTID